MAEQNNTLSQVTEGTTELLHQATEKTTKTVIEHTAKYNDAYSTIDKIMEGFWERVPYFCIALIVITIFWLLSKVFKFFVRKT
ncbi:mechanosensitive ion channel family protein, partial [Salmonella enterica subsp. enterica serovar Enteritidis]|nr:mechanosensitive ion channel family protein [Salmonella enterica subsp. enterica serovar Enteritidis]